LPEKEKRRESWAKERLPKEKLERSKPKLLAPKLAFSAKQKLGTKA